MIREFFGVRNEIQVVFTVVVYVVNVNIAFNWNVILFLLLLHQIQSFEISVSLRQATVNEHDFLFDVYNFSVVSQVSFAFLIEYATTLCRTILMQRCKPK